MRMDEIRCIFALLKEVAVVAQGVKWVMELAVRFLTIQGFKVSFDKTLNLNWS